MSKRTLVAFTVLLLFATLALAIGNKLGKGGDPGAPDAGCGFWGVVYDSLGDPVGEDSLVIHCIKVGYPLVTAGNTYDERFSTYRIYCSTGLTSGDWMAYARIVVDGKHYWSNWKYWYGWDPHESTERHDFHCNMSGSIPGD